MEINLLDQLEALFEEDVHDHQDDFLPNDPFDNAPPADTLVVKQGELHPDPFDTSPTNPHNNRNSSNRNSLNGNNYPRSTNVTTNSSSSTTADPTNVTLTPPTPTDNSCDINFSSHTTIMSPTSPNLNMSSNSIPSNNTGRLVSNAPGHPVRQMIADGLAPIPPFISSCDPAFMPSHRDDDPSSPLQENRRPNCVHSNMVPIPSSLPLECGGGGQSTHQNPSAHLLSGNIQSSQMVNFALPFQQHNQNPQPRFPNLTTPATHSGNLQPFGLHNGHPVNQQGQPFIQSGSIPSSLLPPAPPPPLPMNYISGPVKKELTGANAAAPLAPKDKLAQRKLRNKESARRYREKQVARRRHLEHYTKTLSEQNRELETLHDRLLTLTCSPTVNQQPPAQSGQPATLVQVPPPSSGISSPPVPSTVTRTQGPPGVVQLPPQGSTQPQVPSRYLFEQQQVQSVQPQHLQHHLPPP